MTATILFIRAIGPVEQRVKQRDIWNYHQSAGLGYFEYFRFCEDIGAKPLPVAAAAFNDKRFLIQKSLLGTIGKGMAWKRNEDSQ